MRKIFISLMIILSVLGCVCQSFAAVNVGQVNVFPKAACETLMTYKGVPIRTTYVAYHLNGAEFPAYCLDVNLPGAESGEYVVSASEKIKDVNIWKAVINGFPYKSIEELGAANGQEAFTATKQAVYTMIHNRNTADYGPVNSDAGRRTYQIYCNIVNNARNMNANIIENVFVNINQISDNWEIDSLDNFYLSKEFASSSNVANGSCEIKLQGDLPENIKVVNMSNIEKNLFGIGEHFKILIPISSLNRNSNFNIIANAKLDTKPVMYGATTVPGNQDYALTGFMYEEVESSLLQNYYKNETTIIVNKFEKETTEALSGVKFELLNSAEELVYNDLKTDENGQIRLENLLPGKYYLKEIETVEGYKLLEDLVEVEVSFGEVKEISINNEKISEEPPAEPEVPEEIPEEPPKEPELVPEEPPVVPEEIVELIPEEPTVEPEMPVIVPPQIEAPKTLPRTGY